MALLLSSHRSKKWEQCRETNEMTAGQGRRQQPPPTHAGGNHMRRDKERAVRRIMKRVKQHNALISGQNQRLSLMAGFSAFSTTAPPHTAAVGLHSHDPGPRAARRGTQATEVVQQRVKECIAGKCVPTARHLFFAIFGHFRPFLLQVPAHRNGSPDRWAALWRRKGSTSMATATTRCQRGYPRHGDRAREVPRCD
eukprot:GGOE01013340.1.p2 GENE.GGOE01013340.1~~GGOE01013340.1.p2  ORF type:complete len:196 (+),score=5.55 GGOE01013340.1:16-603(+)